MTEPAVDPDEPGAQLEATPHLHAVPDTNRLPHPHDPEPVEATPADPAEADTDKSSWREELAAALERPDFVSEDRPSLTKIVNHARWSTNLPRSGLTRYASLAYLGVSLTTTATAYVVAWTLERPTRAALAAGLLTLIALWSPSRALLSLALWPLIALLDILTF